MATSQWWVVWYEPLGSRAPGTAASLYKIVSAVSKGDITADSVGGAITKVDGPFTTQADAQKDATGSATTTTVTPGAPSRGGTTNVGASGGADVTVPNPLSGLAAIGTAMAKFVGYMSDGAMWRSLGWVLLGAVLVILGVVLWLKKDGYIPDAIPVPVPV